MALPTTHTTASQPVTGNGSPEASYSTSPTSWLQLLGIQVGELLLVGQHGIGEDISHTEDHAKR